MLFRSGANDILEANVFGLKTKESADLFDKFIEVNNANAKANYRTMVGNLTKEINRLEKYTGEAPEFNGYRLWRAKELRQELLERYYQKKYGDKWGDIDVYQIKERENNIRQKVYDDVEKARDYARKRSWPGVEDLK